MVKLGETLERMVIKGNLEKIEDSEWATPTVAVMKPDGSGASLWGLQSHSEPLLGNKSAPTTTY